VGKEALKDDHSVSRLRSVRVWVMVDRGEGNGAKRNQSVKRGKGKKRGRKGTGKIVECGPDCTTRRQGWGVAF
ncbi:hypothetical protein MMC06_001398, partial [Schaereria dolodes]|nr:hypothetical protein [Schaereria dolodes]